MDMAEVKEWMSEHAKPGVIVVVTGVADDQPFFVLDDITDTRCGRIYTTTPHSARARSAGSYYFSGQSCTDPSKSVRMLIPTPDLVRQALTDRTLSIPKTRHNQLIDLVAKQTQELFGVAIDVSNIAVQPTSELISKTTVKARGWTDTAIQRFLGGPDATRQNPKYRSAPPMCLYYLDRLTAIEATPEFKTWMEGSAKRKKAAAAAVETKRAALIEEVKSWTIKVPILETSKLLKKAIYHFNKWQDEKTFTRASQGRDYNEPRYADESSEPKFLERITVNYIRHQLTSYDRKLEKLF